MITTKTTMKTNATISSSIIALLMMMLFSHASHAATIIQQNGTVSQLLLVYQNSDPVEYYAEALADVETLMTVRLSNIEGTNPNPDLYVSCAGTNYSSTKTARTEGEAVQFVAPAGARADIRVEIFQSETFQSSSNTWSISTRVQPYQPETVSSGVALRAIFSSWIQRLLSLGSAGRIA
ncbi:unnamed protein product [Bathycoccus prasinos]